MKNSKHSRDGVDKQTRRLPARERAAPASPWLLRSRDLMERCVFTIAPYATAAEVAAAFDNEGVGGLPVVADGRLIGIVTKTDLTREYSRQQSHQATALEMMSPDVVTAGEDETAAELAARMLEQRIHRIVVTSRGEVTGVITSFDLLRAIVDYESHLCERPR